MEDGTVSLVVWVTLTPGYHEVLKEIGGQQWEFLLTPPKKKKTQQLPNGKNTVIFNYSACPLIEEHIEEFEIQTHWATAGGSRRIQAVSAACLEGVGVKAGLSCVLCPLPRDYFLRCHHGDLLQLSVRR